jgi:hypothetical protein
MSPSAMPNLPDANSPDLFLDHPTEEEKRFTWNLNFSEWNGGKQLLFDIMTRLGC